MAAARPGRPRQVARNPQEFPLLASFHPAAVSLGADDGAWALACSRALAELDRSARGDGDPERALVVWVAAVRSGVGAGDGAALVRRTLLRSPPGGETALRCLRALARAGEPVDVPHLSAAVTGNGRGARIALAALAEVSRRDRRAHARVVRALHGPLRADAALWLSHLCTRRALDALAGTLRAPGAAGLHAATALLAAEDDPFAFEVLCERLCEPRESVAAAFALLGAGPEGIRLRQARSALARWVRRGAAPAAFGRDTAAVVLTGAGWDEDREATLRALASEDSRLALAGARAAWQLGDAARARASVQMHLRRGSTTAAQALELLVRWADLGDEAALGGARAAIATRAAMSRGAMFEILVRSGQPALQEPVRRAIEKATDAALDAAAALARLREPPGVLPPVWL